MDGGNYEKTTGSVWSKKKVVGGEQAEKRVLKPVEGHTSAHKLQYL